MSVHGGTIPLADSFLVLMIFAAYSCPEDFFTHLRTTEKAPLRRKNINNQKSVPFHILPFTHTHSVTFETASNFVAAVCFVHVNNLGLSHTHTDIHTYSHYYHSFIAYNLNN